MNKIITLLFCLVMLTATFSSAIAHEPTLNSTQPHQDEWRWGQVYIKSHRVNVEITDQIAKTRISQVFKNETEWNAEGTYVFPLPPGVTISDLKMIIDGTPIQAQILEKEEARRIYDEIVRSLRDPALLEYVGTNAIQASVFPIPPGEERTLEIEYTQLLTVDNGLVNYVYPLRTDHVSRLPVGELSISVSVESNDPISNVYSPTHPVAIDRKSNTSFTAGFETSNAYQETDFSLYYGLASDTINVNLVTYRESATENGFFMALISPPFEIDETLIIPKDVIIVLDQSGSMFGNKWDQAVKAAQYVLGNLNPEDRFNVVAFSTGVRVYANELQPVDKATDAQQWLDSLEAIGGTNIDEALKTALAMNGRERQTTILFLTDGLPTEGTVDIGEILKNVEGGIDKNVSIFSFGVGDDVDTFLLDQLSQTYRGASGYVRPLEDIEEEVSALYNKVRAPLFTNITMTVDDVTVEEVFPGNPNLPDMFIGTQLVVVGRYRGDSDNVTLTLTGEANGETQTLTYEGLDFRANAGGEVLIPRLWATRKIGELMNTIRLNGENPELVDSIVRLSIRYGIITPYTSFLITEDDIFTQTGRINVQEQAEDSFGVFDDEASGEAAIDRAEETNMMSESDIALPASGMGGGGADGGEGEMGYVDGTILNRDGDVVFTPTDDVRSPIQLVADRTFLYRDGAWIDSTYEADKMEAKQILFLSDEYFELLDMDERVARFLAIGDHVIFVLDGQAYEIVPDEVPAE